MCVSPVCLSHIELRAHPDVPGSPAHLKVLDHFCKNPFSKKLHVHRLQGLGCEHASVGGMVGGHCSAHYKHIIRKQYNHGHFPHVVHAWWVVSVVSDSAILWMIAQQVSLWDFCKQKYWNGLPCPSPEDLPNPRIEPCLLHLLAWAGRLFTTSTPWEFSGPKAWCKEMHNLLLFYNFTLSVLNSPFLWAVDSRVQGVQDFCPWDAVRPCEHQLRWPHPL